MEDEKRPLPGNKNNSRQIWFNEQTGKFYRLTEEIGEQKHCNPNGALVKPFDPNLTGKYNYDKRLQIMVEQYPQEKVQVELPKSLKPNTKRNYSPQINHLNGYG